MIITVPGAPVPKGRPRLTTRGGFARAYTPAKTRSYEKTVTLEAIIAMNGQKPLEGALKVEIEAYLPIPKATSKANIQQMMRGLHPHVKKPDLDNLCKSGLDALNGIVYLDDAQIVKLTVAKIYSTDPRMVITIEPL